MAEHDLYVHHVGGRGGTVSFPKISYFSAIVHNVIYDADESCLAEIERVWKNTSTVVPYCLADRKYQAKFYLNFCPFTSSLFPFNEAYANYYEEKRLNSSDYVFGKSFECQRELVLSTETIDGLFEAKKIPQVDFLSIDTQGAELAILEGGARMLAASTIAVFCEVSFVELYRGAPLFGDLDAFMRENGFLLATLTPMSFGYKRIPRKFRGLGMPLQGEALYLKKPEAITNDDARDRQLRLEKLAFCALAFGFTELAHEAVARALSIDAVESHKVQQFLRLFRQKIEEAPGLPPLWHESSDEARGAGNKTDATAPGRSAAVRLIGRFRADPAQFISDLRRYFTNHIIRTLIFLRLYTYGYNKFEAFLATYGFDRAAREVLIRRIS